MMKNIDKANNMDVLVGAMGEKDKKIIRRE